MGMGAGRKPPSYNVQAAVDVETSLIVHHEVTNEPTDNRLLYPMARATKEAVDADTLTVVADAGYSNGADAAACERDGITPCVPANRAVNNQGDFFDRTAFSYEPQTDTFRCPAGRTLVRKQVLTRKRSILYVAEDRSVLLCGEHLTDPFYGTRKYIDLQPTDAEGFYLPAVKRRVIEV
jgi:DDE family transposase